MTVVTVRASSWGALFDCAYKWEAEHLLDMRRPSGLRSTLGTAIHAGAAAFDQARIDNAPISIDAAAGAFIHALHNPTDEVDYKQDRSITMREAEVIGLTLHSKYCADIAPLYDFTSVEMKLSPFQIDCGNGIEIKMIGSLDRARVAVSGAGIIIPDLKSGSRIIENGQVSLKGKSAQLGAYQIIYENETGQQTIGAQVIALPTTGNLTPMVSKVWDAKRTMIGTETSPGFIEMAATMFKQGFFPPNPQSPLCSPKFCARWETCNFHD